MSELLSDNKSRWGKGLSISKNKFKSKSSEYNDKFDCKKTSKVTIHFIVWRTAAWTFYYKLLIKKNKINSSTKKSNMFRKTSFIFWPNYSYHSFLYDAIIFQPMLWTGLFFAFFFNINSAGHT